MIAYNRLSEDNNQIMEDKEKIKALAATLGALEKQFGKGSVVRLGNKEAVVPIGRRRISPRPHH
jgi:RecA/RadA recombinase